MKKTIALVVLGVITFSSCTKQNLSETAYVEPVNTVGTNAVGPWNTVFWDDFTNTNQWTKANRKDYNSSYCTYASSAVTNGSVDGFSALIIKATKTATNAWQSGHVKSSFAFSPATNEEYHTTAKIKLLCYNGTTPVAYNTGYGCWPAFWHVNETNWPTNGEVDILEAFQFYNSTYSQSNVFYGTTKDNNQLSNTCERRYTSNGYPGYTTSGWHTYDSYWANTNGVEKVTIKIDGVTITTYTNSIPYLNLNNFNNHSLILNVAVGDTKTYIDESQINVRTSTQMWVDYVKVEKRTL